MTKSQEDIAAWARLHRVCYELAPLYEMEGSNQVQVGYTLDLYALLPLDKAWGQARLDEALRIWEGLREIVEFLAPPEETMARAEIAPPRFAAYHRPEAGMAPEIMLSVRFFHADNYFAAVTVEDRAKLPGLVHRLAALGLKRKYH